MCGGIIQLTGAKLGLAHDFWLYNGLAESMACLADYYQLLWDDIRGELYGCILSSYMWLHVGGGSRMCKNCEQNSST